MDENQPKLDINKPQVKDNANTSFQQTIIGKKKFSLSRTQRGWSLGILGIILLVIAYISYSMYINLEPDAASCTKSILKTGTHNSCAKYAQQLLNGVTEHFSPIPKNGVELPSSLISTNGQYVVATADRVKTFQRYTGNSASGQVDKNTWYQLCIYTLSTYQSYSTNLRTDTVKAARTAYSKVGCASAIQEVTADDLAVTDEETATPASDDTQDSIITEDASNDSNAEPETLLDTDRSTSEPQISKSNSKSNITVVSWNIEGGNPKDFSSTQRVKGLSALQLSADIINLQESHIATFRKTIQKQFICATCAMAGVDFGTIPTRAKPYTNNGSLPSSLPIMWKRERFNLENYGAYTVTASHYKDEHDNKISPKWITWVRLFDKQSGESFYILNTHTVASVEAKGAPQKRQVKRNKIYTQHMDILQRVISNNFQKDTLPIVVTGDFNVNYRYDRTTKFKNFLFSRMTAVGVVSNWSFAEQDGTLPVAGTRNANDTRLIDYVLLKQEKGAAFESTRIHSNSYGSDHFPVFATISVD